MNTTTKPKSPNVAQDFRTVANAAAERSSEAFETIGGAATGAADVMKNRWDTALKGMQDYNSKLIEFSQANIKAHAEFVQRLAGVKSPSEFFGISTDHGRHQFETVAAQSKQLAELVQKVTLANTEPLKAGFTKAHNPVA